MPVRYNPRELQALDHLDEVPEVVEALQDIGDDIAERAKALAPKRTGALAEGIHAELGRDPIAGLEVRVSYSKDEFYGLFHELGTEKNPATPFLRPAAAPYQD